MRKKPDPDEVERITRATVCERLAQEALESAHPEDVAQVLQKVRQTQTGERGKTTGPVREAMRRLAKHRQHTEALRHLREADQIYWSVVMKYQKRIGYKSAAAERQMRRMEGELTTAYLLMAFDVALRWDPVKSNFMTYFRLWRRALGPRLEDVRPLVYDSDTDRGLKERAMVLSITMRRPTGTDINKRTIEEQLPSESYTAEDSVAAIETRDLIAKIRARLIPQRPDLPASSWYNRRLELFEILIKHDDDSMAEIGRMRGVSREAIRLERNAMFSAIRQAFPEHVMEAK